MDEQRLQFILIGPIQSRQLHRTNARDTPPDRFRAGHACWNSTLLEK
jgi:hypothetical protein